MTKLIEAKTSREFEIAVSLFKEYASQIGVDLEFQHFSEEIKNIQSQYSRPLGVLFIATDNDSHPKGCFAIRKLEKSICELKRMYLRNEARGKGIGKEMLTKSMIVAKELGYTNMRLDTLPSMESAIALYQKMGFYEIEPYRFNPIKGTKYFEVKL